MYYSILDSENADVDAYLFDLTEGDVLEDAPERYEFSPFSDFFTETYHECFPEALAAEVFDFVRLVAHPYRRCFDSPAKSPMNSEVESAIKNRGKPGGCTFMRESGKFVVRPLAEWLFFGNNLYRKHYYTSDKRVALLYFDIDCHREYQTEADAAAARSLIKREMLARLGVSPLFVKSRRGGNGYLKVVIEGVEPQRANEIFDHFQEAMRLLFAKHGVLADFEIKGTITWTDRDGTLHAGRYGKLPMCAPGWDHIWHRSLVTAKTVTVSQLEAFARSVMAEVSSEDIARHAQAKHGAFVAHYLPVCDQQKWLLIAKLGLGTFEDGLVTYQGRQWIARSQLDDTTIKKLWPGYKPDVSTDEVETPRDDLLPDLDPQGHQTTGRRVKNKSVAVADLASEPDSFVRQREALLKMARALKRVPTVQEALKFIKDNGLYTGTWDNPDRRVRVRGILKFIAKTFDAKKCTKPRRTKAPMNIGKYDAWAKAKFPNGIGGGRRRIVTDHFEIKEVRRSGHIEWKFISIFVSVCEFCLLVEKNEDGSLPHERAKALWNWLHTNGLVTVAFDDRKWAVCRDTLERYGIIKIDRRKGPGQAWKWETDSFFPLLGMWKGKKSPSLNAAISWVDFTRLTVMRREKQHNPLLHQEPDYWGRLDVLLTARPPPGSESA